MVFEKYSFCTVESCPKATGVSLAPAPQKQDPESGSSPKLIEPLCNCCPKPPDHH